MGKLHTMALIVICVVLLFHFAGLITGGVTGYVLDNLGLTNPQNFGSSNFYRIIIAMSALSAVGVVIGSLLRWSVESILLTAVTLPIASAFILMGWDIIIIFNLLAGINRMFAVMICGPLLFSWFYVCFEFVRSRD